MAHESKNLLQDFRLHKQGWGSCRMFQRFECRWQKAACSNAPGRAILHVFVIFLRVQVKGKRKRRARSSFAATEQAKVGNALKLPATGGIYHELTPDILSVSSFQINLLTGWLLSCRSCRLCREFLGSQCSRRQSAPILTRTGLDWNTNIIQAAIIFRWLSNLRAGFEYRIDWRDPNL